MLKAHQACIDLEKSVLRIQGREVAFLPEHQLPQNAVDESAELQDAPSGSNDATSPAPNAHFPGSGNTIGAVPTSQPPPVPTPQSTSQSNVRQQPQRSSGGFPEKDVAMLMDLGATRETAISALQAAGGNVDLAAGFIF